MPLRLFLFALPLFVAPLLSAPRVWVNGQRLTLPFGPPKSLASPDGSHLLYGAGTDTAPARSTQLWIEDNRTKQQRKITDVARILSAGWSSDGLSFFVEDDAGSNIALAYLYETATLKRLDIAELISASDAEAKRFAEGHAYFHVREWMDAQHLQIDLTGHTDSPPVDCFDLRYRVGRDGTIERLSRKIAPINSNACKTP
jgi:hypothetical protein